MAKIEVEEKFINIETVKDGEIGTITGEAKYSEPKKVAWTNVKQSMLNIPMEVNGKSMDYSPFDKNTKKIIAAWGDESKSWIGKQIQFLHIDKKLEIRPLKAEKK
jgi:hypothetical protein